MLSKSTVKYIQSLQQKKFRDEHGSFLSEGPKVTGELLMSGLFSPKQLFATSGYVEELSPEIRLKFGSLIQVVEDFELEKIAGYTTPNRVVAEFAKREEQISDYKNKITLVLDDIQDPGNLGTIIRTADWFGIQQIICSKSTVDVYNPKVVQSTMASIGRVKIMYADLQHILENKKVPVYAATINGKSITSHSKIKEGMIVIGNESKGINASLLQLCDEQITIDKKGEAESLNAAIATAVILYALS